MIKATVACPERKILLAIGMSIHNRELYSVAINLCKRLSASLDILNVSNSRVNDGSLEDFLFELQNEQIYYRLVKKAGAFDVEVADYVKNYKCILFVVMHTPDGWPGKKTCDYWGRLGCPLVITGGNKIKK